jgi:hypothetical protein
MIEPLWWKNGDKVYLGLVKNPTEHRELARLGKIDPIRGITGEEIEIRLEFENPVVLIDLKKKKHLGDGKVFRDHFKPWEGNLYQVARQD